MTQKEEIAKRKEEIKERRHCIHCGEKMNKVLFDTDSHYNVDHLYICFNDECGYYVRGWEHMKKNYNQKVSYRYKVDPINGLDGPIPVATHLTYKEGLEVDTETENK